MLDLKILFFVQIMTVGILIVLSIKLLQMKKQVDDVIKEIYNYISFVTQDEQEKIPVEREGRVREGIRKSTESQDELQNKLIQSVLGEYFL